MKKTWKRWASLLLAAGAVTADDASRDIPTEQYTMHAGSALGDNLEHNEGPADYAKDGNESTWWHTALIPPRSRWKAIHWRRARRLR